MRPGSKGTKIANTLVTNAATPAGGVLALFGGAIGAMVTSATQSKAIKYGVPRDFDGVTSLIEAEAPTPTSKPR
ncbi:MAG TPA: hypothetical protein VD770_01225 [Coxiellaceae bacterium]|nr:hypothetical protein [Coxiellaceae bacterium]